MPHAGAQRWIRYAPCSQCQSCMAAVFRRGMCARGLRRDFPRGTWECTVLTRICFQALKLTCLPSACRVVKPGLLFHPSFTVTLSPLHKTKTELVPPTHIAYVSNCSVLWITAVWENTEGTAENIKGSLLQLRNYNSPRRLINTCVSNKLLSLSKLYFSNL